MGDSRPMVDRRLGSDYLMKWGSVDYARGPNGPTKRIARWMGHWIEPPAD